MAPSQQRFAHYLISQNGKGAPVELKRSPSEVVFLAFDTVIKRLVELHVLKGGAAMDPVERRSALERAHLATEVRGNSFMRVLHAGEEDGVTYFASNLSDGEFAEDYVARRGAVPAVTAFCLMLQFVDDLVAAQSMTRLVSHMRAENALVTTLEDAFLQLRVVDYGFSESEKMSEESGMRRVFGECCRLLFLLLTGQKYDGQNVDRFPTLTSLPTNLRANLRTALTNPREASPNIERLRDDLREAYAALVSNLQARNSRKHIAVTESLAPVSELQQVLLETVSAEDLLRGRFDVAGGEDFRRHPFVIPAVMLKGNLPVTVHLLPPTRVVDRSQMEAVPLQMWRFNSERHPNIVRSLSVWENPEWTFLTEEREPGFTLSRLMAERVSLNPPEVLAILRQVRAGLDQAQECGVQSVDIHPSNLIFKVGKGGAIQAREFEKLITKRIDAWPPFVLKVRTHMTMRSLYEPLLVEAHPDAAKRDERLAVADLRCRSLVGLAVYLLTGERQVGSEPAFGETVPPALAAYLNGCLTAQKQFGSAPQPADFITAFEQHMPHEDSEGRGLAMIRNAAPVAPENMESAGAVSDFEEGDAPSYLKNPIGQKLGMQSLGDGKPRERGIAGMVIWAVAGIVLAVIAWLMFGGASDAPQMAASQGPATGPGGQEIPSTSAQVTSTEPAALKQAAAPAAQTEPATGQPRQRTPEEIRKALKATQDEIERARREKQKSQVAPSNSPSREGLVESTRTNSPTR